MQVVARYIVVAGLVASLAACGGKKSREGDADTDEDVTDGEDSDVLPDAEDVPSDAEEEADGPDACPPGYAWNPYETPPGCVECTITCDQLGETGEIWEITALDGQCVCTTEEGYYYSLGGVSTSRACDKDGDGWVREPARPNVESEDPAIAANARCDVRVVDRIVLVPEGEDPADGCTVTLTDTFELYEPDDRDDQVLLNGDTNAPAYGGRKLSASELNGLTKACVHPIGDFNGNGVPDVEDSDSETGPMSAFSYFIELHRGWYEDGAYHIQEKSRATDADPGWGIALRYNDEGYWRECVRLTDSGFSESMTIGMDFARYNDETHGAGMFHHSQFKCVQLVESNPSFDTSPHLLPLSKLSETPRRYILNSCNAEPESEGPVVGETNPADPLLSCMLNTSPEIGDVGFASVKYIHYEDPTGYVMGCVNSCLDAPISCTSPSVCVANQADYGRAECGCINNYDPATYCTACLGNYDLSTACVDCLPHFDILDDCSSCSGNWTGTSCDACIGNFDISTGCTACLPNYDITHTDTSGDPDPCAVCINHYDITDDCSSCEDHWDPATLCSTCLWSADIDTDCATCIGAFIPTTTPSTHCRETTDILIYGSANPCRNSDWNAQGGGVRYTASSSAPSCLIGYGYRSAPCYFTCNNTFCAMARSIDVSGYHSGSTGAYCADGIDDSRYVARVSGYFISRSGGQVHQLVFKDGSGGEIRRSTLIAVGGSSWLYQIVDHIVPPYTRSIELHIWTANPACAAFDNLTVQLIE